MKQPVCWILALIGFSSCNTGNTSEAGKNKWVPLRADSINVVTLADTLVIYESVCRGCAFEGTVQFGVSDSLGIVELLDVITTDNNSPESTGGSASKDILLKAVKPGNTTFKLYKILAPETAKDDSSRFVAYTVEVKK